MFRMFAGLLLIAGLAAATGCEQMQRGAPRNDVLGTPREHRGMVSLNVDDLRWQAVDANDRRSPQLSVVYIEEGTNITHALLRVEPNYHIPLHWHSANESITVMNGSVTVVAGNLRREVYEGGYNFAPARMQHEIVSGPQGAVLKLTSSGPLDINWVAGPNAGQRQTFTQTTQQPPAAALR